MPTHAVRQRHRESRTDAAAGVVLPPLSTARSAAPSTIAGRQSQPHRDGTRSFAAEVPTPPAPTLSIGVVWICHVMYFALGGWFIGCLPGVSEGTLPVVILNVPVGWRALLVFGGYWSLLTIQAAATSFSGAKVGTMVAVAEAANIALPTSLLMALSEGVLSRVFVLFIFPEAATGGPMIAAGIPAYMLFMWCPGAVLVILTGRWIHERFGHSNTQSTDPGSWTIPHSSSWLSAGVVGMAVFAVAELLLAGGGTRLWTTSHNINVTINPSSERDIPVYGLVASFCWGAVLFVAHHWSRSTLATISARGSCRAPPALQRIGIRAVAAWMGTQFHLAVSILAYIVVDNALAERPEKVRVIYNEG